MNITDWQIIETAVPETVRDTSACGKPETRFSLANGHFGLRGDFEEAQPAWQRGTYINGFFETEPIVYGELAYGFAKNHQTMLNVPDSTLITLKVDGEQFDMTKGNAVSYRRTLDMKSGILERNLVWCLESGREIELNVRRLVSFTRSELAAISYSLHVRGKRAHIEVSSAMNLGSHNIRAGDDPRVGSKLSEDAVRIEEAGALAENLPKRGITSATVRTKNSGLHLACTALTVLEDSPAVQEISCAARRSDSLLEILFEGELEGGETVNLTKYLAYSKPDQDGEPGLVRGIQAVVREAEKAGFAVLADEQRAWLDEFWASADVIVEGDPAVQQALRFNLFHLVQSAGRDGKSNLAAKGLSGEGYEGHYFWDTEIYALPLFTFTRPGIARGLLMYRYSILDTARERAKELDFPGALFPWRTIDGTEASAYYEAGTAQYHINADIVHAARRYALVSGDRDFMEGPLAEMAVETARFWYALGDFIDRSGLTAGELARRQSGEPDAKERTGKTDEPVFCINCVTGPDEYTALVNNNVFTNLMARMNLDWAENLITWMKSAEPEKYRALAVRLRLKENETADWARAADRMFVPYDERRKLYPQDDSFFNKAVWNVNDEPPAARPLLLHYHPLNIYRYQVLKQPDLVLAQFLQGDLFTAEEKKRNFTYYEPITTGDSSLSHCIQSIMAAETGETEKAWNYFCRTVRMDIDDLHHNVHDGIHAAAMAGSWLSMIYGFGGFREHVLLSAFDVARGKDELPQTLTFSFHPVLPPALTRLCFRLDLGTGVVELDCRRKSAEVQRTTYRLVQGESVRFKHGEKQVLLDATQKEKTFEEITHERDSRMHL
jgi:alpha,alpha-trehalose phosphorylase